MYKNDHRTAAAKVTAELSIHLKTLFPQKQSDQSFTNPTTTIKGEKDGVMMIRPGRLMIGNVTWSGEPSFTLFPTSGQMPKEVYNNELLVPTVTHGGGSAVIWAALSWYSAGSKITVSGRTTASDCVYISGSQLHPAVQMQFPNNDAAFPNDSSPKHS